MSGGTSRPIHFFDYVTAKSLRVGCGISGLGDFWGRFVGDVLLRRVSDALCCLNEEYDVERRR